MVKNAIIASVSDLTTHLERHDPARARSHLADLIALLGQIPAATKQICGPQKVTNLSRDLNKALEELGEETIALTTLRGALLAWLEDNFSALT